MPCPVSATANRYACPPSTIPDRTTMWSPARHACIELVSRLNTTARTTDASRRSRGIAGWCTVSRSPAAATAVRVTRAASSTAKSIGCAR